MKRTDVHRPSALVTEDYEYAYAYDSVEPSPSDRFLLNALIDEGWHFGENASAGDCFHCGARLRYVAVLKHAPTHTLVKVGEDCLSNRFALASADFHRLRKAAELNRAKRSRASRRAAWLAVDEDREIALRYAEHAVSNGDYGWEGLFHRLVHTYNRADYMPSDKLVRFVMRSMARDERIAAEREAQRAVSTPVVEGKGVIVGTVVSTKWHENDYGGRAVMTVRDDRGFTVWGSVPRAIDNVERGNRVTFSATVERSDRDETFGFFKRPSKASII